MSTTLMRNIRIAKGWTLQWVGDQIGLTRDAVNKIETGKRHPSYEVIIKLQTLFEEPIDLLLTKVTPNEKSFKQRQLNEAPPNGR